MSFVELRASERGTRDAGNTFSCTREFWDLMLALGNTFGWKPLGTSYLPTSFKIGPGESIFLHDYCPGDWSDPKRLTTEDALAWAAALSIARDSSHFENMTASYPYERSMGSYGEPRVGEVDIRDAIDDFIDALRQGLQLFATSAAATSATGTTLRTSVVHNNPHPMETA